MANYILPELEFDYGALEPHISARIMELHHAKHHAAYVKNVNETLAPRARDKGVRSPPFWNALWRSTYPGTYSTPSFGNA